STIRRELYRLGHRKVTAIHLDLAKTFQHLNLQAIEIKPDQRRLFRRRTTYKNRIARLSAYLPHRSIGKIDALNSSCHSIQARQIGNTILSICTSNPLRTCKSISRQPKDPLRLTELSRFLIQSDGLSILPAIEIPPAAAVRDEIQHVIRRPLRLEDRFINPTCYPLNTLQ